MQLDLNQIPVGEEVPVGIKEELVEDVGSHGYRMGGDVPFRGPWETLTPTELTALYNMVEVPVNYHRIHHFVTHRANGSSEHAWIAWLPTQYATLGGTVIHSSEWKTVPTIFHGTTPLAAPSLASRAPGRVAPDVLTSPHLSMMEGRRSSVRLEELENSSEDGTDYGVPITKCSVPTPYRSQYPYRQNQQAEYIGSSSQQGAENLFGASLPTMEQLQANKIDESVPPAAKRNRRTWKQHRAFTRAHQQTWTTEAARNPPAVPLASPSRRACNTSPGVGVNQILPSLATVLSTFTKIRQTSTPTVRACSSVSSSAWKKRPMPLDTVSAPAGSFKFKLFNVDINIAAEKKASPGHGGHSAHGNVEGNVNPPRAQNLNGVEAGGDVNTPPLVTEESQSTKLVLPRKKCETTAEWSPYRMSW